MGPLNNYQAAIQSLRTPLSAASIAQQPSTNSLCSLHVPDLGPSLQLSTLYCNFYLHISCSKMPQQLKHPTDSKKTSAFVLLPKPVYLDGMFCCDACGHKGSGFSYHCKDRKMDLHILCAGLPTVDSNFRIEPSAPAEPTVCSARLTKIIGSCVMCAGMAGRRLGFTIVRLAYMHDVHLDCVRRPQWPSNRTGGYCCRRGGSSYRKAPTPTPLFPQLQAVMEKLAAEFEGDSVVGEGDLYGSEI